MHPRLADFGDGALVGQVGRAFNEAHFAGVGHHDFVFHAGGGGHQVKIILALQPFLDDLHVEQPQKAATEAEVKRVGRFRLEDERGVVELQSL